MDILAETLNGEHVNDAVYNRNKTLEEKYNVVIKSEAIPHSTRWRRL